MRARVDKQDFMGANKSLASYIILKRSILLRVAEKEGFGLSDTRATRQNVEAQKKYLSGVGHHSYSQRAMRLGWLGHDEA